MPCFTPIYFSLSASTTGFSSGVVRVMAIILFLGCTFVFVTVPGSVLAQQGDVTPGVIHIKLDLATAEMARQTAHRNPETAALTGLQSLDAALMSMEVSSMEPVFSAPERFRDRHKKTGLDRWFTVRMPENVNVYEKATGMLQLQGVELAEPDYRAVSHEYSGSIWDDGNTTPMAGQGDIGFENQWHYMNDGAAGGSPGSDIDLVSAWQITTGSPDVIVQVIDSGIDYEHPDLEDMLWVNPSPGSSVSGFDIHGWNWVSNNSSIGDHSGHGTHVSGTIAARNGNGIGVAGIAGGDSQGGGARLMIGRIFEPNPNGDGSIGAGADRTAMAIVYGADNGAVISNNSWGYVQGGPFPSIVREAVDYFIEYAGYDENGNVEGPVAGGVFISSAGNTPNQVFYYPAAYAPVISVAATDFNDQKSSYSNYGTSVDISAPGGQLLSGNPFGGVYSTDLSTNFEAYSFKQGTSMASPHVAGVAALIASHFPGITNEELIARLLSSADFIDDLNPQIAGLLGSGRVNAFRALTEDPPPVRPNLMFPDNEAEDLVTTVEFGWEPVSSAATYHFQLSRQEDFTSVLLNLPGLTETYIERRGFDTESTFYWRVRGVSANGTEGLWSVTHSFSTSNVVSLENGDELPESITLSQNYPNPFNPVTQIAYALSEPSEISISVYNMAGQRVATLYNGMQQSGRHQVAFDGSSLSSGVYIYQLRTSEKVLNRKMVLVK